MDGFNVLRGREPIKNSNGTYYCAGYVKFLPARGAIYGIEFSGSNRGKSTSAIGDGDLPNTGFVYNNPLVAFKYFIFCSEDAMINYAASLGIKLEKAINKHRPEKDKEPVHNVGNPATYIVSSGKYDPTNANDPNAGKEYPQNIGFQGADYQHDPRPYSNLDASVVPNDVQYPLYIFVQFTGNPTADKNGDSGIDTLDYQLITLS